MTDEQKCQTIDEVVRRTMATDPPNIGWMNGDLAHRLLAAFNGGRTLFFMQLMKQGLSKEEAEEQVAMQLPLLAFDLGLKVGMEHAAVQQMRDMFGEDPPEFPL